MTPGSRPLTEVDPIELVGLWAELYPAQFVIGTDVIRQQIFQCPLLEPGLSRLEDEAFIACKRGASPELFAGPKSGALHISAFAFSDPGDGLELLESISASAREQGYQSIVFGQDHDHLLPGCPKGLTSLEGVLQTAGFVPSGEEVDLERDMAGYTPPAGCLKAVSAAGAEIRTAAPADFESAERFLLTDFPGRWHHDVMRKLSEEPHQVDLLFHEGRCAGFSFTQDPTSKHPVAGCVWKASLGDEWGGLGPIGVSASVRGKGLGGALLGASLQRLSREGRRQTIIDWTTLAAFYEKHGFEVTRTYASWSRTL